MQLVAFIDTVEQPTAFNVRGCEKYGDLVRVIDLSLLNGRWERVSYHHLDQILHYCEHITHLNINLCQYLEDSEFERLFSENQAVCQSLVMLDIGETMFAEHSIQKVLRMLPNIKTLGLGETYISDATLSVIAECFPELRSLDINQCTEVHNEGIDALLGACKKLQFIDVNGCYMLDDERVSQLNSNLGWESDYSSVVDSDGSSEA
ncbi:hypothetical protein GGI12_000737 [Dipsacomyces acuminosporus]|nr:hypothetical protein GGI12_000737 [Dipsacomyces acuminosporus]